MRKTWSKEEVRFLEENYSKMSAEDIAKKIGRTRSSVEHKVSRMKLESSVAWTNEDIEFLKAHYKEGTYEELAKRMKHSKTGIANKVSELGLKKSKYTYDYNYFKTIDTEEKAYWFGFIYADGWTQYDYINNIGETGIDLQKSDFRHLKKFNKSISGNLEIGYRTRKDTQIQGRWIGERDTCFIRLYSSTFAMDLINKGVVPNKSLIKYFPKEHVPEELMRHFIRGYFDGNGCISGKNVTVYTGSLEYARGLHQYLTNKKINCYYYKKEEDINCYIMYFPHKNKNQIKFLDYIYENANIFLDRKMNKYFKLTSLNK